MKTLISKIKKLNLELQDANEKTSSAARRLQICENFGASVIKDRPPPVELEGLLKAYQEEREKIFADHTSSTAAAAEISEKILECEKEKVKLAKSLVKAQEKQQKEKAKAKQKKLRKKAEAYKEKLRIKAERQSFWPKKVYRIIINLEPSVESALNTPDSSRRNSIAGDTIVNVNLASTTFHEPTKVMPGEISLSLSYITYSASWSPRYDLSLDTTKCTGILEYGADLKNTTSESWRDAKIVLSTSQTTFSGLSETIPIMYPWNVRLQRGHVNSDGALYSNAELIAKRTQYNNDISQAQKPRHEIFGADNTQNIYLQEQIRCEREKESKRKANVDTYINKVDAAQQMLWSHAGNMSAQATSYSAPTAGGLFGSVRDRASSENAQVSFMTSGSRELMYGNNSMPAPTMQPSGSSLFGAPQPVRPLPAAAPRIARSKRATLDLIDHEDLDESVGGLYPDTVAPNSLVFEEGAWEETGLTTTYDVPGSKTLVPSNSTIKHKIAKVTFNNIVFSHIIIGKLRQVAFLKARLRNASKITLLKGPLGLTLDGSFLGQTTFPRCSAGEVFSLPLGVDPTIQVSYPKPTVRRSQSGIFSKEESNVYTRTMVVTNTKHNASIELTVLDQVPVSEDERLKIDITSPRGLRVGGDRVRTGINASDGVQKAIATGTAKGARASVYAESVKEGAWGKADAVAKKGGEINWSVVLMPGCGVKLALEYEMAYPAGEGVVGM